MPDQTYPGADETAGDPDDVDGEPDGGPPRSGMPRWVKVSGIIAGALVLLFVALRLTGIGGDHGPGRHIGDDGQEQDGGGGHDPSNWDH